MSNYVLDNSVAMRWFLASQNASDQIYAEKVLHSMTKNTALVPSLWHLEAANVLLSAEKRKEVIAGDVECFIAHLENLPINIDSSTSHQAFNRTLNLARSYNISSYDAAYLELSVRECLPIATLDKDLEKAALKAGVALYLK